MSTIKRLFNVGKGKARVAQKEAAETDWVDVARHRAADAAEAVADAIRPPERAHEEEPDAHTAPRRAPAEPEASGEPAVEDAQEVAAKIERSVGTPKKRSL